MPSRPTRRLAWIVTLTLASAVVAVVGLRYLIVHGAEKAFSAFEDTHVEALTTVGKKVVADLMVVRKGQEARNGSIAPPQGYLVAYEHDPEGFKADAKLAETWFRAFQAADEVLKSGTEGNWVKRSDTLAAVKPANRADAWGNTFCILRRHEIVAVVSAGPSAKTSPQCADVPVSAKELALLPRGRLLESPAGNYVLVLEGTRREGTAGR